MYGSEVSSPSEEVLDGPLVVDSDGAVVSLVASEVSLSDVSAVMSESSGSPLVETADVGLLVVDDSGLCVGLGETLGAVVPPVP